MARLGLIWLGILALPLLALLVFFGSGRGVLVRYDPMYYYTETEPAYVRDVACSYFAGTRFVTVFSLGNTTDATCARVYQAGTLPACPRSWREPLAAPILCEDKPEP